MKKMEKIFFLMSSKRQLTTALANRREEEMAGNIKYLLQVTRPHYFKAPLSHWQLSGALNVVLTATATATATATGSA